MKRRPLLQTGLAGYLWACTQPLQAAPARSKGLQVQWLGHTCFLFISDEGRLLINPFRPAGCTAGYRRPEVAVDLILLSSRLLDEGALDVVKGNPRVLYQPGVFTVDSFDKLQGVKTLHDRKEGRRFGVNVAWRWRQAGLDIVHLGVIAAPLSDEEKILLGKPDLLFVPVGGGEKGFDPELAHQATEELQPRMVVPTYYRTEAAEEGCELGGVDSFLQLFKSDTVKVYTNPLVQISAANLPKSGGAPLVRVFAYDFSGKTPPVSGSGRPAVPKAQERS
ncbi:MBL fold metallo-hydrolase [Gloeobacter morelensis]|uniref:MBL fold metallo-hydrolase n=1 Tax=Gloeobacter morelensis MG652769 TaxID=2781736 RepID=A0ABY3PR64_9CYAN|nr:MBL fold metallo-hydrolase [Gloeobacter morelensis]UFP96100.1 MBL fold metallo-hydrolase [Gloeobacter morelensis MG652769]